MSTKVNQSVTFYPWILLLSSAIGLVASVWQAAERVQMLKNPGAPLACNLNPVVDCGGVLSNHWASLFGFPNAFIGIAIFAMLLMSGVLLVSNGRPSKAFMRTLLGISIVLILFAFWFFSMSLYVIGKICLFCIFIWAVSVPIFWYGLLNHMHTLSPRSLGLQKLKAFGEKHHLDVVVAVYAIMVLLFVLRFRSYYFG